MRSEKLRVCNLRRRRSDFARRRSQFSILNSQCAAPGGAFTLAEIIVVVAIIGLLLGIVVPGISSMWNQRLEAQAENVLSGLLRSVQVQARSNGERGLLFYLEGGVQKAVIVEAVNRPDCDVIKCTDTGPDAEPQSGPEAVADCFRLIPGSITAIPAPYRVAPRTVLDANVWDEDELDHLKLSLRNPDKPGPERHWNYFTILFGPDGRARIGRDVLIVDPTGLTGCPRSNAVKSFEGDTGSVSIPFAQGSGETLKNVVAGSSGSTVAVNFRSVDGLLVYDESRYEELKDTSITATQRRAWLGEHGKPYYISPLGGAVIRGPIGE